MVAYGVCCSGADYYASDTRSDKHVQVASASVVCYYDTRTGIVNDNNVIGANNKKWLAYLISELVLKTKCVESTTTCFRQFHNSNPDHLTYQIRTFAACV